MLLEFMSTIWLLSAAHLKKQSQLSHSWRNHSLKELGNLQYSLRVKIDRKNIWSFGRSYVERFVEKFRLTDCKSCYTPSSMEVLTEHDGTCVLQYPYRDANGSLMYLMLCTKPDIVNALGCVAEHCDNYDQSHWIAVKRIIRYLNPTTNNRLYCGIGMNNV